MESMVTNQGNHWGLLIKAVHLNINMGKLTLLSINKIVPKCGPLEWDAYPIASLYTKTMISRISLRLRNFLKRQSQEETESGSFRSLKKKKIFVFSIFIMAYLNNNNNNNNNEVRPL
jgi:hypothetical protein